MFFKHQDMRDDLIYHPEWTPSVPATNNLLSGCPFAETAEKVKGLFGF